MLIILTTIEHLKNLSSPNPKMEFVRSIIKPSQTSSYITSRGTLPMGTITPYDIYNPRLRDIYSSTGEGYVEKESCDIALVFFRNNPEIRIDINTAKDVCTFLIFYDAEGKRIFKDEIEGRWGDFPEPIMYSERSPRYELLKMQFPPNGSPRELCVAIKYINDSCIYIYDLNSYDSGFKNPDMKIQNKIIYLNVILRGSNINELPFWFVLNNTENFNIALLNEKPESINCITKHLS